MLPSFPSFYQGASRAIVTHRHSREDVRVPHAVTMGPALSNQGTLRGAPTLPREPSLLTIHALATRDRISQHLQAEAAARERAEEEVVNEITRQLSRTSYEQIKRKAMDYKEAQREIDMDEHRVSLELLYRRYDTKPDYGVRQSSVKARQEKDGRNELTPPKRTPKIVLFLREMTNTFAMMLWVGMVLCLITYAIDRSQTSNVYLAIVLATINVLTGGFSYYQNAKSTAAMDAMMDLSAEEVTVVRDGQSYSIDSRELVKGDLVRVNLGERVPADIRIIKAVNFKVEQSSLTGETDEVSKGPDKTSEVRGMR